MSAATVMRLVPERHVPRALSILFSGVLAAMISAAPMGSYLGDVAGWRTVPGETESAGGLFVAAINLAIATGAALGGVIFDASGVQSVFLASGVVLVAAAAAILAGVRTRVAAGCSVPGWRSGRLPERDGGGPQAVAAVSARSAATKLGAGGGASASTVKQSLKKPTNRSA